MTYYDLINFNWDFLCVAQCCLCLLNFLCFPKPTSLSFLLLIILLFLDSLKNIFYIPVSYLLNSHLHVCMYTILALLSHIFLCQFSILTYLCHLLSPSLHNQCKLLSSKEPISLPILLLKRVSCKLFLSSGYNFFYLYLIS